MRSLIIAALMMGWGVHAKAQTIDCRSIVDPITRLQCFDTSTAAQPPKVTSLREEVSRVAIAVLESPPAIVAAVAALLALISGIAGPIVQLKIGRAQAQAAQQAAAASNKSADATMLLAKNAGNREIARLRMGWIEKVRDVLSEYHAILMHRKHADGEKLLQLGTQLDLLLNENDKRQKDLLVIADRIFKTDDIDARQNMDRELVAAGRAVFDGEWRKVKAEMKGEEFQTGE